MLRDLWAPEDLEVPSNLSPSVLLLQEATSLDLYFLKTKSTEGALEKML